MDMMYTFGDARNSNEESAELIEGLARQGLRTSKRGPYAEPRAKPYAGILAGFAPRREIPKM